MHINWYPGTVMQKLSIIHASTHLLTLFQSKKWPRLAFSCEIPFYSLVRKFQRNSFLRLQLKTRYYWFRCAWCRQPTNPYLKLYPSIYMVPYGVTRPHWVRYTSKHIEAETNGRHFADDILKCIFLNENVWIPIKISLKFVPKGPINNIPSLVQIIVWRRSGDKPLFEPVMVSLLTHICVTHPQWVNMGIALYWISTWII